MPESGLLAVPSHVLFGRAGKEAPRSSFGSWSSSSISRPPRCPECVGISRSPALVPGVPIMTAGGVPTATLGGIGPGPDGRGGDRICSHAL